MSYPRLVGLALALLVASPVRAQEGPLARLDTLRVDVASRTGEFPARARVVQVLTAEELRALPVRSVADALRWMASADVQARSPAQADLSVRGSTFEQVVVLVDGVRMSDPQTGHFDLDLTVPLHRVERIELLAGAASALYGSDAMGGVVNVVTRDGGDGLSLHGERGTLWGAEPNPTFVTWRAAGSTDGTLMGVQVGGGVEWDDSEGHRPGTDYETLLVHGRLSAPTRRGRLFAQAGHGRRDFGADSFYAARPSYEETRTTTVSAGWSGELGGFVVRPLISLRRHGDDFTLIRDRPEVYRNVHSSRQRGAELSARRRPLGGVGVSIALGGELYRDDIESDNRATTAPDDALGSRVEDRAAGFAELGWAAGRGSASAGLRADWHEGFGAAWSPAVSASLDLLPSVRARASWGRSYRAPTWTERFYRDPASIGDPDLRPERSWTAEAGADFALPESGVLRATVFRRQSEDLIDWVRPAVSPPTTPSTVRNVEEARFDGLELALERLELAGFEVDAAASWLDLESDEAAGLISRYALRPIEQRASVVVSRVLVEDGFVVSASWLRERRRTAPDGAHQLLGARARLRLPLGEIDVIGSNLADERYKDIIGTTAPGRAVTVAYRLELSSRR